MKAGTIISDGKRAFVVLKCNGPLCAVAPVVTIRAEHPRFAGDVLIADSWYVRTGAAKISAPGAMNAIGEVTTSVMAECLRWAARCTLTAQIIAKQAPLASWHREAANERTAVR